MAIPTSRSDKETQSFEEGPTGEVARKTHLFGKTSAGAWLAVQVDVNGKLVVTE